MVILVNTNHSGNMYIIKYQRMSLEQTVKKFVKDKDKKYKASRCDTEEEDTDDEGIVVNLIHTKYLIKMVRSEYWER